MSLFKLAWLTSSLSVMVMWCSSAVVLARFSDRAALSSPFTLADSSLGQTHSPQDPLGSIALRMRLTQAFYPDSSQRLQGKTLAWQPSDPTTACPAVVQQRLQIPEPPPLPHTLPLPNRTSLREQLLTVLADMVEGYPAEAVTTVEVSSPTPSLTLKTLWTAWQHPAILIRSQPSPHPDPVQVRVNGRAIATLDHAHHAEHLAEQIRSFVTQPDWDAAQLVPALLGPYPAMQVGRRIMVVIDDAIVPPEAQNRELLAIDWTNNLRQAFGVEPLELVTAQQIMYGIQETPEDFEGVASWYGPMFHGRLTANGETYNQEAFTAAHPYLPFNTYLKVINLESQEAVIVRINDRGPYIQPRTLDLSRGVARCIESKESGVVPYRAVVMSAS